MCKFIGKSNEWIFYKLSKSEILRLYSIVRVAMETTKMPNFTCQSKSFISIFFTCQVSACEMQPFSCHDLANDMYSQTAKIVFSHLKSNCLLKGKSLHLNHCLQNQRSSYVQVTITTVNSQSAWDVKSHSLHVKVLDFAPFVVRK